MSIWKHKWYNIQHSFLCIKNNNDVEFHVNYGIPQLNEKPSLAIFVL